MSMKSLSELQSNLLLAYEAFLVFSPLLSLPLLIFFFFFC